MMRIFFLLSAIASRDLFAVVSADKNPFASESNALLYLQQFGYMAPMIHDSNRSTAALIDGRAMRHAVENFQRMAGVNVTGEIDDETAKMMNMPRCGVKDMVGNGFRAKRYVLQGTKWVNKDLTYTISKYPRSVSNKAKVEAELAKAFKVWSDHTPLTFTLKKTGRVNIEISFVTGEHGDGDPFSGPGGTLAHAFFPRYGGDIHFDDSEKWTIEEYGGINLFQVAAHEIGHSLGLSHSDIRSALMAPFYRGYDPYAKLDEDDIDAIQKVYGKKTSSKTTDKPKRRRPVTSRPKFAEPDMCSDTRIDAITRTEDKSTYVFRGQWYWKLEAEGIASGYPRKIQDDWAGVPNNIDAALTWSDGKTFFFKGGLYWRFKNKVAASGYPQKISVGFAGIPNDIDAAFVWSGNGKTYFFKGDKYWRYDSRAEVPVSSRYPQEISVVWEGIPSNIHAAFQWQNGYTYFFKDQTYYRFNDKDFTVDQGSPAYPRSTAEWWFDCKESNKSYLRAAANSSQTHQGEKSRRDVNNVDDDHIIGKVVDVQAGALLEGVHELHEEALTRSAAASSALNLALVISSLIVMLVLV
ncbi:matrix metalloproteinase-14 [Galendromus occidentalis]|uniref:Matrix metalloproteinase-14 n=1 Tax=Galendromus occidentalis TaxID=34638 RepID=A0AAJ6QPN0_9ACAR|nr:matrix metalloproteinase-14 [Galendromus occidentalis]